MKLAKGTEQGVFVILMLALAKDHQPVSSQVLSKVLGVSDSYLKKILRKLVCAGLVGSSASPGGGFTLARPITDITLEDVFVIFEEPPTAAQSGSLAHKVFLCPDHTAQSVKHVDDALDLGWAAFLDRLRECRLSDLLIKKNYEHGVVDWARVAAGEKLEA